MSSGRNIICKRTLTSILVCCRIKLISGSKASCRVTRFLSGSFSLAAQNQFVLLTVDRFLAARNVASYYERRLNRASLPLILTTANYILSLALNVPVFFIVTYDVDSETCILLEADGSQGGLNIQLMAYLAHAVVLYSLLPLAITLSLNIYIVTNLRFAQFLLNSPFSEYKLGSFCRNLVIKLGVKKRARQLSILRVFFSSAIFLHSNVLYNNI